MEGKERGDETNGSNLSLTNKARLKVASVSVYPPELKSNEPPRI